jgi:hypothetical protein
MKRRGIGNGCFLGEVVSGGGESGAVEDVLGAGDGAGADRHGCAQLGVGWFRMIINCAIWSSTSVK